MARGLLLALLAPLLLMGCIVVPGRFDASLDIAADRSFTYRYRGEIVAIDLEDEFAKGLKDTDTAPEKPKGVAWQTDKAPTSKDATFRALADALRKEAGYRSVEYKGDGLFQIDYAISGRLAHAFIWPYNADAELVFPFLTVELRGTDGVRIKAPAFGKTSDARVPGADKVGDRREGIFTLTTDAEIVSQNNEDGAKPAGPKRTITWKVTPLSKDPPMAVLKVAPLG
ncbi:hypothetical protein [Sphingomonas yantingensis]|uniref:Uncharacterized protein n=1 Tax=Sphingomonas yantingensis TaxID=1241761 RepID=A0A7W9AR39_9SPHN|nr:hypothetical protein [Sphingomonas yantingensis]MBB5699023.1 hypothetical protein [Sphingomonas yantingensis]